MTIGRYERLARIIIDTMRLRADDPAAARCDRCQATDEVLYWGVAPNGGIVEVCAGCGDLCGCTPAPPCPYPPQGCGADPGQRCAADCPQAAADGVPDPGRW